MDQEEDFDESSYSETDEEGSSYEMTDETSDEGLEYLEMEEDDVSKKVKERDPDDWTEDGELQDIPYVRNDNLNLGPAKSAEDCFKLLFNPLFMTTLVESINYYASRHNDDKNPWQDTTIDEMYVFLAWMIHTGNFSIFFEKEYAPVIVNNVPIQKFMRADRFASILRNFRFSDLRRNAFAKTVKYVHPILDFFNNAMKVLAVPAKNLIITESDVFMYTLLVNGRQREYGVLLLQLSDSNGITHKIQLCRGPFVNGAVMLEKRHDTNSVMSLMEDNFNLGHSLYLSEHYTSITLAEKLLNKSTYLTGNLSAKKRGNPSVTRTEVKRGEIQSRVSSRSVAVLNFRDKNNVVLLSTEHRPDMVEYRNKYQQIVRKPKAVIEFSKMKKRMRDRNSSLEDFSDHFNNTTTWHKRIVLNVINIMIYNSYKLYIKRNNDKKIGDYGEYRADVVKGLLKAHLDKVSNVNSLDENEVPSSSEYYSPGADTSEDAPETDESFDSEEN